MQQLRAEVTEDPRIPAHGKQARLMELLRQNRYVEGGAGAAIGEEEAAACIATIDLGGGRTVRAGGGAAAASGGSPLRTELLSCKVSALRRRAVALGAGEGEVDDANDSESPKAALIELIVSKSPQQEPEPAVSVGGGGSPVPGRLLIDRCATWPPPPALSFPLSKVPRVV